jgi:hypothetical protein
VAAVFAFAQLGFIFFSKGDWMEGGRFFVPVIPLMVVLAVLAVDRVLMARHPRLLRPALVGLAIVQLVGLFVFAMRPGVGAVHTGVPIWEALRRPDASGVDEESSVFARVNRQTRRQLRMADHLSSVVGRLHTRMGRPPMVMSGQAGFVMYTLARERFGEYRFMDRFGLSTTHFISCDASHEVPRRSVGLMLTYEEYFRLRHGFDACGVPTPDVIFDIGMASAPATVGLLEENGYALVYEQKGATSIQSPGFAPQSIGSDGFILVRRDLLEFLDQSDYALDVPIS